MWTTRGQIDANLKYRCNEQFCVSRIDIVRANCNKKISEVKRYGNAEADDRTRANRESLN